MDPMQNLQEMCIIVIPFIKPIEVISFIEPARLSGSNIQTMPIDLKDYSLY